MKYNFPGTAIPPTASPLVSQALDFAKGQLYEAEGGHDWFHALRVLQNASYICEKEGGNLELVQLIAVLHDVGDSKFHEGDETVGPKKIGAFLESKCDDPTLVRAVLEGCERISFRKNLAQRQVLSLEAAIVQDADRLDAIGAIGIARTFNFGGHKGRPLYHPEQLPNYEMSTEEYKKKNGPTINHFFEKLLLLKEQMNTATGTQLAQERHDFMEAFLYQFFKEWNATN